MLSKEQADAAADRLLAKARALQTEKAIRPTGRARDWWDWWLTMPFYVRTLFGIALLGFVWLLAMESLLDGSAHWGSIRDGHYFVGKKIGAHLREVSALAWHASRTSHWFPIVAVLVAVIADQLHRYRNARIDRSI